MEYEPTIQHTRTLLVSLAEAHAARGSLAVALTTAHYAEEARRRATEPTEPQAAQ